MSRRRTTTRYLASGLTAAAIITGTVVLTNRDPGEQQARGSAAPIAEVNETKTSYKPIGDHLAEVVAENKKLLAEASPDQQALLADGYVSRNELELAAQANLDCLAASGITDATYKWDDTHNGISFTYRVPKGQNTQARGDACDRTHFDAASSAYAVQVDLLNDPTANVEQSLADCRSTDLASWPTVEGREAHCWNQTIQALLNRSNPSTSTAPTPADDGTLYLLADPASGIVGTSGSSWRDMVSDQRLRLKLPNHVDGLGDAGHRGVWFDIDRGADQGGGVAAGGGPGDVACRVSGGLGVGSAGVKCSPLLGFRVVVTRKVETGDGARSIRPAEQHEGQPPARSAATRRGGGGVRRGSR